MTDMFNGSSTSHSDFKQVIGWGLASILFWQLLTLQLQARKWDKD